MAETKVLKTIEEHNAELAAQRSRAAHPPTGIACPECGTELVFQEWRLSSISSVMCPACEFKTILEFTF